MKKTIVVLSAIGLVVLASGCKKKTQTVSCNKPAFGMCTEMRGYPAKDIEVIGKSACSNGTLTDAPCPTKNLIGSCERAMGYVDGEKQSNVDFYYRPPKPPHTETTIRNLCSNGTWSDG